MIAPIVGKLYQCPTTGMVVEAVARMPHENNYLRFPGRVLFAGKSHTWASVGQRVANLSVRTFEAIPQTKEQFILGFNTRVDPESDKRGAV